MKHWISITNFKPIYLTFWCLNGLDGNEGIEYDEEIFSDFSGTDSDWIKMYFHLQDVSYANGKCMSHWTENSHRVEHSFVNRNSWISWRRWKREWESERKKKKTCRNGLDLQNDSFKRKKKDLNEEDLLRNWIKTLDLTFFYNEWSFVEKCISGITQRPVGLQF